MPTPQEKKEFLKNALKLGTVCVSVVAWYQDENGIYIKPKGVQDTHWVWLEEYDDDDYPLVFDSYADGEGDPYEKKLDKLYDFGIAIVYYLEPAKPKLSILSQILNFLAQIVGIQAKLVEKKLEEKPIVTPDEVLPPPVKPPKKESKIEQWAKAVQVAEGWTVSSVSYRCKNPGNLKYAPLTVSFGATGKLPASDGGYFCIFPSYEVGFKALCEFLKLGAEDRLKAYHNSRTLLAFTKKYANPPNDGYARSVAKALGVDVNINIKELL